MKLKVLLVIFSLFLAGNLYAQQVEGLTVVEQKLVAQWKDLLDDYDSVVILNVDSMKPAKVAIYNCTVKYTLWGLIPPQKITLSLLHFPNTKRMEVGKTYLCFMREKSRDDFVLIRSDMYFPENKDQLQNFLWEPDSQQANLIEDQIK